MAIRQGSGGLGFVGQGFFAGGVAGGWLAKNFGVGGLFAACGVLMAVWLAVAWPMRAPPTRRTAEEALADEAQAT